MRLRNGITGMQRLRADTAADRGCGLFGETSKTSVSARGVARGDFDMEDLHRDTSGVCSDDSLRSLAGWAVAIP